MATIASAERSPEAFQILSAKDCFVGNGLASRAVGVCGDAHARFSSAFDKLETEPESDGEVIAAQRVKQCGL